VAGTVGTDYDAFLRVSETTVNGTHGAVRLYDDDGLLETTGALTLTRHPAHGLVSATTLGTVTDSRTYTAFGEIETYTATADGTPALAITYGLRDALGRLEEQTETVLGGLPQTREYEYDTRGRLERVTTEGTAWVQYTYDENGNRLTRQTSGGGFEGGTYDDQDRLLTYAGATYTYSANGDLETKTVGGQTTTYGYDALGNLRHVTLPGGTALEYVIDPENRRVGKQVDDVLVQGFLYEDQLRIVAELDGAGAVVSRFVYGTRVNVPEYLVKGGSTYRIVTDHLGSPRLVVDASDGTVVQRMAYDEFGRVVRNCPVLPAEDCERLHPFGFAGGLYDPDTELVRFGARDYDPQTGRWTAAGTAGAIVGGAVEDELCQ
jgi:RHS repeat-associated protein